MDWQKPTEKPRVEVEVIAEVAGFNFARFIVAKFDGRYWWQHIPNLGLSMESDGWVGIGELTIKRWAYIV